MIIYLSGSKKLWVRQIPLRTTELLLALPGPVTLRQTRYQGPEKIASQSTVFPSHKAIREYPGIGKLLPARKVETWVFALQAQEYPTQWEIREGLLKTKPIQVQLDQVRVAGERIRMIKVLAEGNEVHLPIPSECLLKPFQGTEVGLEPNLFDRAFGEDLAL